MARHPIKDFKPHGYYYEGNTCTEIQINNTYEVARYRISQFWYNGKHVFFGNWQEIRYDKNGKPFIRNWSNYRNKKRHIRLYFEKFISR